MIAASHDKDQLEEIVTERMTEEIEDDLTTLQQKNNQSPLVFYGNLGSSYLISFKRKKRKALITQSALSSYRPSQSQSVAY